MNEIRDQIDQIDQQIITLLKERMSLSKAIGDYKKGHQLTIDQPQREAEIKEKLVKKGELMGLSATFINEIYQSIFTESKRLQTEN